MMFNVLAATSEIAAEELLWKWCRFGWNYRRFGSLPVAEQDWHGARIKREMDMILGKGLADFFLFTSDTIRWAKDNNIPIGPGRGSTAASDVAYATRITEINPHRYPGMLFERFLDETRHDPPDIDVDCSDERRHEVYDYIAWKYGAECVGHIATFTRYKAKNSLADVARVFNIPAFDKDVVANLAIERSGGDARANMSLTDTFEMFPAAKKILEKWPNLGKACRLEGDVRNMSVHACGLMVANSPLTEVCAVYEHKGERVLSFDKIDAEYVDALKLDFLGLAAMGMIARCLAMAGLTLEDLYAIPDTDPETLELFRRGDVVGIFQFGERATRLVLRDVRPEHFRHLTDVNALSRPGPLFSGQTAEYCMVRHGRKEPTRLHPLIDEITSLTYGQMIYQEHILECLKRVGNLQWTNVHHIRRIIAKKAGIAAFQQNFKLFADGAYKLHGIDEKLAEQIWQLLITSGSYAFNIAHAVSYTMLAFWTAWLKIHYPMEFYAASLAKATGDKEQQYKLMRDALAHGIDISPPRPNISASTWTPHTTIGPEGDQIRMLAAGWMQIPGIAEKKTEAICEQYPNGIRNWPQLMTVHGIGGKTVSKIEDFCTKKDPFDLYKTERKMQRVRRWLKTQSDIPFPTATGATLAAMQQDQPVFNGNGSGQQGKSHLRGVRKRKKSYIIGGRLVYAGVVKQRNYKDAVEATRAATGKEADEILAKMYRPDLLEYCSIRCYDDTEEEIYVRFNRFIYPQWKRVIESIHENHDVIVCVGHRIEGFGTPMQAERIWVVDPD
jgi:DNA polymerase III subunit alpha